jgi:hypothetical protein
MSVWWQPSARRSSINSFAGMGNREKLLIMQPTPEQVERATDVLSYFVAPWNLPVNPEDLAEMAYAVLVHFDSDASWDEIGAAVKAQIDEHREEAAELDRAYRRQPGGGSEPPA